MVQNIRIKLENDYFDWMYHLVCNDKYYNKVSYKKLLYLLHSIPYRPRLEMDEHRRIDGINFRYRFGSKNGYSRETIRDNLDIRECSLLEMMVALAYRVEEEITSDNIYGDRTGQWFWSMIVSLGLSGMNDTNFNKAFCERKIKIFLNSDYQPNGKGGLFTLNNPKEDLRNVEIWCQFMWYLNEIIYNTNFLE